MGVAKYRKDEKDRIEDVLLQSGIHIKPLYTGDDLTDSGFDYTKDLGNAGEYPFTRGIHKLGSGAGHGLPANTPALVPQKRRMNAGNF